MADRNTPSAFDAAFAELDAALIDLDGDGRPDVAVPQQPRNALLRGVPDYGFGPVTPMSREGYMPQGEMRSYQPSPGESAASYLGALGPVGQRAAPVANALLNYGPVPAQAAVEQFDRAGTAVADAYNDPSLANVTNAGAQTALAVGRPVAAGGILAAGMMEGARRDFAPDIFSPANALTRKQTREQEMRDREAARQREAEANRIRLESEARRGEADAAAVREAEAEKKRLELQKQQEANAEYRRAVSRAESMRNEELAKKWSFSDSNMGQVFRESGGLAPMAFGALGGAAGRLLHGDRGNVLSTYALPILEGAMAGVGAANAPVFADYLYAPKVNPDKAAAGVYGRELPPGHPRKQEYLNYAASEGTPGAMPDANPVYKAAEDVVWNEFPERFASGAFEGGGGGMLGATVGGLMDKGARSLGNALAAPFRGNALVRPPSGPSGSPGYGAPRSTYTPPATPQTRVVRQIVGKDGRTYHFDENGDFTSAPKK
jgi:hypothetical protein